ncbi:hypothetical protein [Bacillus phage vB_BanS-Thrax1]|nr:hypothetical protein [Bacillus phage vB_BanS-Thrax1]
MEKLNIKVGAKAKAIASEWHFFEDGTDIEFVKYGAIDDEDNYYEYVFRGIRADTGEEGIQFLEADEFTLLEE